MADFLTLLGNILHYLYELLNSPKIESVLGVNLFQALVAFFIMWTMLQIFVFRQKINPGALISSLPDSKRPNNTEPDENGEIK